MAWDRTCDLLFPGVDLLMTELPGWYIFYGEKLQTISELLSNLHFQNNPLDEPLDVW